MTSFAPSASSARAASTLSFDPFATSRVFRVLRDCSSGTAWLIALAIPLAVLVVNLLQGTLFPALDVPYLEDLKLVLGFDSASEGVVEIPLLRDLWSLLVAVLTGLSLVCLHCQWHSFKACLAALEETGAWKWRDTPIATSRSRLAFRLDPALEAGTIDCRTAMLRVLDQQRMARRREPLLALAAGAAVLLVLVWQHQIHFYWRPEIAASALGPITQDGWWAAQPAGAVTYTVLLWIGFYTVMVQNVAAMTAVRILVTCQPLVRFRLDWLNADDYYGWRSLRVVFRYTYYSIALRAIQLTVLLILLGIHNVVVLAVIASWWLLFLSLYVWYPFTTLRQHLEVLRDRQIDTLVRGFRADRLSLERPSARTGAYVLELERVKAAAINPVQFTRWKSSSFAVVVLLPVFLTILQVVA